MKKMKNREISRDWYLNSCYKTMAFQTICIYKKKIYIYIFLNNGRKKEKKHQ